MHTVLLADRLPDRRETAGEVQKFAVSPLAKAMFAGQARFLGSTSCRVSRYLRRMGPAGRRRGWVRNGLRPNESPGVTGEPDDLLLVHPAREQRSPSACEGRQEKGGPRRGEFGHTGSGACARQAGQSLDAAEVVQEGESRLEVELPEFAHIPDDPLHLNALVLGPLPALRDRRIHVVHPTSLPSLLP